MSSILSIKCAFYKNEISMEISLLHFDKPSALLR